MQDLKIENIADGAELNKFNDALIIAYDDLQDGKKSKTEKRAVTYRLEFHEDQYGNLQLRGKLDVKLGRAVPRETFATTYKVEKQNGQLVFEFPDTDEEDDDGPVSLAAAR
jgi:hypothetical protein